MPDTPDRAAREAAAEVPKLTKHAARRFVRARVAEWLHGVGSEPPNTTEYSAEIVEIWPDEVEKIAARIVARDHA